MLMRVKTQREKPKQRF